MKSIANLKPAYPSLVNVYVTRTVAFLTVVLALAFLLTQSLWILGYLLFEFVIRFLYGPRFSLMAKLAIWLVSRTQLPWRMTAGQPKRFAQSIGVAFVLLSLVLALNGAQLESMVLMSVLTLFASLEAAAGFCAACWRFGLMIRWGWISKEYCEDCNNLSFDNV